MIWARFDVLLTYVLVAQLLGYWLCAALSINLSGVRTTDTDLTS